MELLLLGVAGSEAPRDLEVGYEAEGLRVVHRPLHRRPPLLLPDPVAAGIQQPLVAAGRCGKVREERCRGGNGRGGVCRLGGVLCDDECCNSSSVGFGMRTVI